MKNGAKGKTKLYKCAIANWYVRLETGLFTVSSSNAIDAGS